MTHMMNHTSRLISWFLCSPCYVVAIMVICLVANAHGTENVAAEPLVASPALTAVAMTNTSTEATTTAQTAPIKTEETLDLRDVLAIAVRERTELREQVTQLETQKWLLISCAILMAGVAGWLGMMILNRGLRPAPESAEKSAKNERESDIFPADTETRGITSATKRKNATITIRNSITQKEEVTGKVETRRFFTKDDDSSRIERRATTTLVRKTSRTEVPAPVQEPELHPSTDRTEIKASPMEATKAVTATQLRPKTVRVDHHSDRLAQVEVALKPGTGSAVRQKGFSILEVMISMAILATVLASVCSNIYTLHLTRTLAKEESQANEIKRWFAEELLSAPFGSLTTGFFSPNYSSDTVSNPIDAAVLKRYLVSSNNVNRGAQSLTLNYDTPLTQLQIYLEYYSLSDLENAMEDSDGPTGGDDQPDLTIVAPNQKRLTPLTNRVTKVKGNNNTLGTTSYSGSNALVIRIIVQWLSSDGRTRQLHKDITRNQLQ
jgi:prepilin-type N-terminal cleavage/methylation domain-containing protein